MKSKHKEGYCDKCGARLVCANCFSCGHVNKYMLDQINKEDLELSEKALLNSAKRYCEATKRVEN